MTEQLGLFAPRVGLQPKECPRFPGGGYALCRDGREGRCPGGPKCEELGQQETERLKAPTLVQVVEQANAELGAERLRAEIALLSDSRGTSSRGTP